jgi:pimeloyl-ACP methyl ester carboxylesterase
VAARVSAQRTSRRRLKHPSLRPGTLGAERFSVAGESVSAIVGSGTERPVVFLHGNSSTKAVWERQLPVLSREGYPVLAPDLPGHGKSENSPAPERTYSFPGYAAVISALLDTLGWDCVDLVGWSLGGHIGLQLLATEQRINSLLITGTPPAPLCVESLRAAFWPSAVMDLASKSAFSAADALTYAPAMMGGPAQLTPGLLTAARRTDGEARRLLFDSALRGVGADQKLAVETIDKPLCVVHGKRDPFVRLDNLRRLQYRALWDGRIFVIEDAGHAPHWQRPAIFNRILMCFLTARKLRQNGANLALQQRSYSRHIHPGA